MSHQLDFVTVFTCNTEIERDAATMQKGLLDESAKDHLCQRKELGDNSCNFYEVYSNKRDSEIERDFASLLAFHIPSIEIIINQLKEASHAILRLSFALDFVLQLLNLLQNTATHGQPRVKASVADAGAVRRACVRAEAFVISLHPRSEAQLITRSLTLMA